VVVVPESYLMAILIEPIQVCKGPIDQWKIACFASRRSGVQIPFGPLSSIASKVVFSVNHGGLHLAPEKPIGEERRCHIRRIDDGRRLVGVGCNSGGAKRPSIWGLCCGHGKHNMLMPMNAKVSLDASERRIRVLESVVE
jgi:hypothetical protein